MTPTPVNKVVVWFTFAYLAVAGGFALVYQNWEFAFYISVVIVLAVLIMQVHKRVGLPLAALWALSIWGLLHMIGGLMPTPASWPIQGTKHVFYSLWIIPERLKYDQIVHAYGFAVSTWICWLTLRSNLGPGRSSLGVLLISAFAGMGLGALNEIVEFAATLMIKDTNVGDATNTGWDLVSNAIGSFGAAIAIAMWERSQTKKPPSV